MFHKYLFILAHSLGDRNFYQTYKKLSQNQWKKYEGLKEEQDKQLRYMINFAHNNVPYYRRLFDNLKLHTDDIRSIEDLEKLPILTKEIIKSNWGDFKPINLKKIKYFELATGGSIGTPFRFRITKFDRFLSGASLYRGWGYGNYDLADEMVILGGSSLDIGKKSYIEKRFQEITRNLIKLSSFDMGSDEMREYVNIINSFKPKFIRGYASSIYLFSKWLKENNLDIYNPRAIFTTAEKLYPHMRDTIEKIFNCDIYDGYGLNDGGVAAYECSEHSGLHIDMERSVMEIVDKDGKQLDNGEGKILATSLYNYAMPFIRYDTNDLGFITNEPCRCGRGYKLLKEVIGRDKEFLITPEGKKVHGAAFFNTIFAEILKLNSLDINDINQFQVIQNKVDGVIVNMICKENFNDSALEDIKEIIRKRNGWRIDFNVVDKIEKSPSGKHKFIINNIDTKILFSKL